ncbi:Strictosidine synthase 3 [Platanthera zijinensis]|uniref:Strictosidine synthase 3 n=1 Tax=Platanthera zijinensis TaxID=2320716 RepID=A0AAP0BJ33_9ASPA
MASASVIAGFLFLLAALYCGTDPFNHAPMAKFPGFEVYPMDLPPWSSLPATRDTNNRLQKAELRFVNQVQGPESVAFDPLGRGPYTGVADGRILFWNGESWSDFAYTSPNRSEICSPKPSPLSYLETEHICGRPLGLRFDMKSGDLYIADAYFGLLKVGSEGGLATPLATEAEGIPFKFTNDFDIDEDGSVYFTDSSSNFQRRNFMQLMFSAEPSGRLLKYNPITKQTSVLLRNLQFPNGVSLSKDRSFLVFSESSRARLSRYWLKGEKAGTSETFTFLPGAPDNVRSNEKGEFWVALHCRATIFQYTMSKYPLLSKFLLKLPVPAKYHFLLRIGGRLHGIIARCNSEGKLIEVLEDSQGKVVKAASEVEEKDGELWIGSVLMPFIAVYKLQ